MGPKENEVAQPSESIVNNNEASVAELLMAESPVKEDTKDAKPFIADDGKETKVKPAESLDSITKEKVSVQSIDLVNDEPSQTLDHVAKVIEESVIEIKEAKLTDSKPHEIEKPSSENKGITNSEVTKPSTGEDKIEIDVKEKEADTKEIDGSSTKERELTLNNDINDSKLSVVDDKKGL